jgi:hypothetical protein
MQTISLKHGEIKTLSFTYTQNGLPLTIAAATITAIFKNDYADTAAALSITNTAFTKASNTASFVLDTSSLTANADYYLELKTILSAASVDKSDTIFVKIEKPVDE